MNTRILLMITAVAFVFSACTSTRFASTTEYDDVYFTSSDKVEIAATPQNPQSREPQTNDRSYERNRQIYENPTEAYDEDDFYYSRRLRRFGQSNSNNWRYYDPYFANDLYYVMGSPAWNRWNNNGWYSWSRPRFGSSFYSPFGFDGYYGGFNSFRYGSRFGYNPYNYYNPFVNTYFNYGPTFGYSPFGVNSFGGGFYDPFGYYNYSSFYCPPSYYTSSVAGYANYERSRARVVSHRATRNAGVASQTSYSGTNPRSVRSSAGRTPRMQIPPG